MGSAQSSMFGPEALTAGAIVVGAAVTAVALDNGWFARSGKKKSGGETDEVANPASSKKGGKKSKEDKEFDKILADAVAERRLMDAAAVMAASATRVVGVPDVVPGAFDDTPVVGTSETKKKKKRKAAKKGGSSAAASVLVTSPENSILQVPPAAVPAVVAGEGATTSSTSNAPSSKKSKKRKSPSSTTAQAQVSSQPAASSSVTPSAPSSVPKPKSKANTTGDASDGGAWTHVEMRKRTSSKRISSATHVGSSMTDADSAVSPTGTSASASVSLTGDEPTTETSAADTGAEATDKASADEEEEEEGAASGQVRTTTESLTGVEDMLPPPAPPARVLRVVPGPNDRPAPGFSWGDYEDADISTHDAEDEDDDEGWGVVRSRRSYRSTNSSKFSEQNEGAKPASGASFKASETMTKRKRQNEKRREQEKAEKDAAEKERLRLLREHQRGLEKTRMDQQSKQGKVLSGGSKASLTNSGKLVWD